MENKETFNAVAEEYEKYRPTYPEQLFEDIIQYTNLQKEDSVLEIGCGTGQATSGMVNKGHTRIICIELGSNLAHLTADKFRTYPAIRVVNSAFEQWDGAGKPFKLAISGTAFHFIEPEYGYRRVAELLDQDGCIGFFWTVHVPQYNEIHNHIRQHYRELAPDLDDSLYPSPAETIQERKEITAKSGLYEDIIVKEYDWIQTFTSQDYIALLNTNSRHRQLPEAVKETLLHRIQNTIDEFGGKIDKDYKVALFLARKSS